MGTKEIVDPFWHFTSNLKRHTYSDLEAVSTEIWEALQTF